MKPIVTLTLNPSIDSACRAEKVQPAHKIRTHDERYDPGGGGINVARVIRELGGEAFAIYLAGGMTGDAFDRLVENAGIQGRRIEISGATRVSHVVYEQSSGQEYRFTPEGPVIKEAEWRRCLAELDRIDCDVVVASGSLPRGVPGDFYTLVAARLAERRIRFVLDTSGEALAAAFGHGLWFAKPSLGELETVVGRRLTEAAEQDRAARELVRGGAAEMLAVTLGPGGALLATADRSIRLRAPDVEVRSAVGAGDSFVAAMTLALARGEPVDQAFAFGVATGTATVLTMGTELCRRIDAERLFDEIRAQLP